VDKYLLPDGTEVEIRPIRADDGARLRASHARLSAESRYQRFLASKPELTEADARYLVEVDGCNHHALVATLVAGLGDDPEPIVAVARYVRLPGDPRTAEFAIVVGDLLQQQGLATQLMTRLAEAAYHRGVRRFTATMLSDNLAIHHLLTRIGAQPPSAHRVGSISEIEVELAAPAGASDEPDLLPSSSRGLEADRTGRLKGATGLLRRARSRARGAGDLRSRAV
jgi:RimJ/RimL family protein N-acetyltransferase